MIQVILLVSLANRVIAQDLEAVFGWNQLRVEGEKSSASVGDLLGDVRLFQDDLILAVPRLQDSKFPVTLASISLKNKWRKELSPELHPFPDKAMNQVGSSCQALQNVMAIEVSPDGLLWVVDSGIAGIFRSPVGHCPPKLVVFDLKLLQKMGRSQTYVAQMPGTELSPAEKSVVFSYTFPDSVVSSRRKSILIHLALDFSQRDSRHPERDFVYCADMATGRLIIFDRERGKSWSQTANQLQPVTVGFSINARPEAFVRSGLAGLALQSSVKKDSRRLFMATFGPELFAVRTEVIRNSSLVDITPFLQLVGQRASGSDGMTSDDRGRVYFAAQNQGSVLSWNSTSLFEGMDVMDHQHSGVIQNLDSVREQTFRKHLRRLIKSPNEFQWINSLFIHQNYLWIVVNSFHKYVHGDLSLTKPNFKIFRIKLASQAKDQEVDSYMTEFVQYSSGWRPTNSATLIALVLILTCLMPL